MLSSADRRALQSVATQFFVNGVVVGSYLPRLPEIRDRIGADFSTLGLVLTLASLGGLVASATCSLFLGLYGSRATMIMGGVVIIITLPLVGVATSPFVLWLTLSILLMFDVYADVAMNLQGSVISGRRPVPVMNRLHGLWSLGTVLGGLLASGLAELDISLRQHLVGVSALLLVTMLYVAPGLLPESAIERPIDDHVTGRTSTTSRRVLGILAVLGAMSIIVEVISGDWAALRLSADLGAGAGLAGLGYVAFTTGMVIGRFFGDHVVTRIGSERLVSVAGTVAAAGLALATLVPVVAVSLLGYVVAGLGVSVLFPHLYDRAAQAPGRPGAGLGAMTGGSKIGTLLAPLLVGLLADTSLFGVGAAVAIVTLPATAVILALRVDRSPRATQPA